jgi:hypothetical protein
MYQFQQLANQLNWRVCAKRVTERRRDDQWNVGLHVLGSGVSIVAARVHGASEFMRGRRGRRRNYVQHSDPDAAAAPELRRFQFSVRLGFASKVGNARWINVSTTCGSGWVNHQNSKSIAISHARRRPTLDGRWY